MKCTQGNRHVTTEEFSSAHDRRERPSDLPTRDDIPSIVEAVLDSLPSQNAGIPAGTNAADPTHVTEAADVGPQPVSDYAIGYRGNYISAMYRVRWL